MTSAKLSVTFGVSSSVSEFEHLDFGLEPYATALRFLLLSIAFFSFAITDLVSLNTNLSSLSMSLSRREKNRKILSPSNLIAILVIPTSSPYRLCQNSLASRPSSPIDLNPPPAIIEEPPPRREPVAALFPSQQLRRSPVHATIFRRPTASRPFNAAFLHAPPSQQLPVSLFHPEQAASDNRELLLPGVEPPATNPSRSEPLSGKAPVAGESQRTISGHSRPSY
ncbi:disintegrin and metalloproteinase domain-containing protein 29 [Striga asiatica]|uniref:Disintegrin and metalloproteinase domain-containing protein 29 n=1 Tax=Striga asiatica TaxID=4170 RepID=A0A5A7PSH9_STRAF|nr:disintegrin and metalloproteinase domain-containing protein 29 [Striga asiatica]